MKFTHKNKNNKNNKTKKNKGGIGKLDLTEVQIEQLKDRAILIIRKLLLAKKENIDIIHIGDIKLQNRVKKTGQEITNKDVYVGDEKMNRADLCFILAELTGIEKFRINQTTTSGSYEGHVIFGKKMRTNYDMMMGVDYLDNNNETIHLFGIKDLINEFYSRYSAKYLESMPETNKLDSLFAIKKIPTNENEQKQIFEEIIDKHPSINIGINKENNISGDISIRHPSINVNDTNTIADKALEFHSPIETVKNVDVIPEQPSINPPMEPFTEEDPVIPKYRKIRSKLVIKQTSDKDSEETLKPTPAPEPSKAFPTLPKNPDETEIITQKPSNEIIKNVNTEQNVIITEKEEKDDKENELEKVNEMISEDLSPIRDSVLLTDKELLKKERAEYDSNKTDESYNYLYPELNDPNFNVKIAKRKEFNDTKFDGTIHDIEKQA